VDKDLSVGPEATADHEIVIFEELDEINSLLVNSFEGAQRAHRVKLPQM